MAKKQSKPDAAEKPGFEQALGELEEIVRQLEQGEIGLGPSLARYEQGVKLLRRCYDYLEKAERRIELLSGVDAEGKPVTTPLDDTAVPLEEKARRRSRRSPNPAPGQTPGPEDDAGADGSEVDRSGKLF